MKAQILIVLALAGFLCVQALAQNPGASTGPLNPAPGTAQVGPQSGAIGLGGAGGVTRAALPYDMTWMKFINTVTRLNMTPDFTLDKDAKAKIQALGKELEEARAKFAADHQDEMAKINAEINAAMPKDQAAWGKPNPEVAEAVKKLQAVHQQAPGGEPFVAKAKALMTPEQVKALDAELNRVPAPRRNERGARE